MKIFREYILLLLGSIALLFTLETAFALRLRRRKGWKDASSEFIFPKTEAWDSSHQGQGYRSPVLQQLLMGTDNSHRGKQSFFRNPFKRKTAKRSASFIPQSSQGTMSMLHATRQAQKMGHAQTCSKFSIDTSARLCVAKVVVLINAPHHPTEELTSSWNVPERKYQRAQQFLRPHRVIICRPVQD
ncbi:uncharacterized protein LOC119402187 [Rhipicephalus sanguineus]|uniref:uncharacterized protein LOC119402187 n=1 Tax=Rhipicephalus sanguineus TaxID=34632 RepID=UPI00189362EC|nr:uncharacterized protein LOC119402187 [Rhipicephalus sanguineus]